MKCVCCRTEIEFGGMFCQCPECSLRTIELNRHRTPYMVENNLWTIAVTPESNVPSGNCNFSRIDSEKIWLELTPGGTKVRWRYS